MKLHRIDERVPGFGNRHPGGSYYRGFVAAETFYFRRFARRRYWEAFRGERNGVRRVGLRYHALWAAKAAAALDWLGRAVDELYHAVRDRLTLADAHVLSSLSDDVEAAIDALAPQAYRDWLHDHGFEGELERLVLAPGRRARVLWPDGWERVAMR